MLCVHRDRALQQRARLQGRNARFSLSSNLTATKAQPQAQALAQADNPLYSLFHPHSHFLPKVQWLATPCHTIHQSLIPTCPSTNRVTRLHIRTLNLGYDCKVVNIYSLYKYIKAVIHALTSTTRLWSKPKALFHPIYILVIILIVCYKPFNFHLIMHIMLLIF